MHELDLLRRRRVLLSVCVGAGWFGIHMLLGSMSAPFGDVSPILLGSEAMLRGGDPYELVGPGRLIEWGWRFYYPGTALWAVAPFAFLPAGYGSGLFVSASMALLAYACTSRGLSGAGILLSAPVVLSGLAAQWTPLLTAGYLLPSLCWTWWAKPNFALPFLLAGIGRRHLRPLLVGGAVLMIGSMALLPNWLGDWWELVHDAPEFRLPILTPWVGPLILLVLLKWRRSDARLLVGISLVPQTPRIYNAVPLLLVASTPREMMTLIGWSWIAWMAPPLLYFLGLFRDAPVVLHHTSFVLFLYAPAVLMILGRENRREGWLGSGDPMHDSNDSVRYSTAPAVRVQTSK